MGVICGSGHVGDLLLGLYVGSKLPGLFCFLYYFVDFFGFWGLWTGDFVKIVDYS